jgi:hypothetical protein
VPKKEEDILQIRKYLNGELDAKAMHRLERRAQDDPFLMDALEGYESAADDQQGNLRHLNAQLHQRLSRKERKIIPWRFISVAASILVVAGIGALLLLNKRPVKSPVIANNVKLADKQVTVIRSPGAPAADTAPMRPSANSPVAAIKLPSRVTSHNGYTTQDKHTVAAVNAPVVADNVVTASSPVLAREVAIKDTTPLNEMIVMNYTAPAKKETRKDTLKRVLQTGRATLLQSKVEGVSVAAAEQRLNRPSEISGLVIGRDDGLPIAGAQVHIAGSGNAIYTNANGRFKVPVDSGKVNLSVGYIGYKSQQVNISPKDSLKIALEPNSNSLSEVVVSSPADKAKASKGAAVIAAHPRDGSNTLKKYINANAVSPDGKTGEVELSLLVNSYGEISRINVVKGLSDLTDKKAIALITRGPGWTGSSSGKAEVVAVKINFRR